MNIDWLDSWLRSEQFAVLRSVILPIAAVVAAIIVLTVVLPRLAWWLRWLFFATNYIQWFLASPLCHIMRDPKKNWPRTVFLVFAPALLVYGLLAYLCLMPIRLLNALYFDLVLFWTVSWRDALTDLVAPRYADCSFLGYVARWVLLLPVRVLIFFVRSPGAVLQSVAMVVFDTVWPTLTLFHGTSLHSAHTIARSGRWLSGNRNYVGTGVYFGLAQRTAEHYARIRQQQGGGIAAVVVVRVTPTFWRPVSTLAPRLRSHVGTDGDAISRGVHFPWATLQHWRSDTKWYEFCLVQRTMNSPATNSWRVRPICIIERNSPVRVPGSMSIWPNSFMGCFMLLLTFLLLAGAIGLAGWYLLKPNLHIVLPSAS